MNLRRTLALAGALATALACASCGLGRGVPASGASVRVTEGFGDRSVRTVTTSSVPGSETVLGLLRRSFRVSAPGGNVASIDGRPSRGSHDTWSLYVNGVRAKKTAAGTSVHNGDRIWWDLHDGRSAPAAPAVVGSFPEPFLNGVDGRRYPTTLECAPHVSAACRTVTAAMAAQHVPVSSQLLGTGSGPDTLGVVVGTWRQVSPEVGSELIAHGPGASGVYARFAPDGRALHLLDAVGGVVKALGPGAGLIAATADPSSVPSWLITGTDPAGVLAAARALTPRALADHFALAVQGGTSYPVPVASP